MGKSILTKNENNEYTLIFLKPETVKRKLIGKIISRFENKNLEIIKAKIMKMDVSTANEFYSEHKGKFFYDELISEMCKSEIFCIILHGKNAIQVVRKMVGSTNPFEAEPGTIRGDFGLDYTNNIIHASDSESSYIRESNILFP